MGSSKSKLPPVVMSSAPAKRVIRERAAPPSPSPSTIEDIERVLDEAENTTVRSTTQLTPWLEKKLGTALQACDYNEVYPRIYVSDLSLAKSVVALRELGITHVLNMAAGALFMCVDTTQAFYDRHATDHHITFLGIDAPDTPGYMISVHFARCSEWIRAALAQNSDNKVLVHCLMGFSRSPTIVAAYLMLHHDMSAAQAMHQIATQRFVHPNAGFVRQLAEYDAKLFAKRNSTTQTVIDDQEKTTENVTT